MSRAEQIVLKAWARGLAPRPVQTVSAWADANRVLSKKASAEPGAWRTDRNPLLRAIMDDLSDPAVQRVVVMKSTQVGVTEVGLNWLGYHIDRGLGPMLVVLPTLETRKRWVLQRYRPMLQDSPTLKALAPLRKRDSANGETIQDFPNAFVVLSGANSGASLRSIPVRHVLCDEVDGFPWTIGGEGDPLGLIERRMSNFPDRTILLISTPTIKGQSRIADEYEASDQRRYHVPCPECGHMQPLVWGNLIYSNDMSLVHYACAECGAAIHESAKAQMLIAGRWIATYPERRVRGYHINGLYAPIGLGLTWSELAQDWKNSQGDVEKLQRFINTVLGQPWVDERVKDVTAETIAARAEPYAVRTLPPGCLLLTAGVDTQDDRVAITILGHGQGKTWVIDWVEIPGNPGRAELWQKLTDFLLQPIVNQWGRELPIEATAIDSGGHFTTEVYAWVMRRAVRRAMAVKGSSTPGKPILNRGNWTEYSNKGKRIPKAVRVWLIGTDTAKHHIMTQLGADEDQSESERRMHFPTGLPLDYYRQLTGEIFNPAKNRWQVKRGHRVEALDCTVYALAASQHPELRVHAMTPAAWARRAAALETAPETPSGPERKPTPSAPPSRGPLIR